MVTETEIGVYDKSITSPTFDVTMSMCIRHEQEETYTRFFIANSIDYSWYILISRIKDSRAGGRDVRWSVGDHFRDPS